MTPSLRTARTCTTATILSLATAIYGATINPWLTTPGLWVGTLAWWSALRAYEHHRITTCRPREQHTTRPAKLPPPCCQLWTHSNGEVHGPDCTRPPLARRDRYRLSAADAAVFQQLAARIDLPGPNDRSSAA